MASSGGGNGGDNGGQSTTTTTTTTTTSQYYFCYQCNRTISLSPSPSPSSELVCPTCNGGFLEEVENPNPNPNLSSAFNPFFSNADSLSSFPPFLFPSPTSSTTTGTNSPLDPLDLSAIFGGGGNGSGSGSGRSPFHDPDVFNPFQFLQNYLQTMRAGGANIQFVIENNNSPDQQGFGIGIGGGGGGGGSGGAFRVPSNLGDYFFGPGLEQLIQQLAENDPNRYGTPPAAKSAVEGLPSISVTKELLASDSSQCAVCMDEFKLGAEAKQMPCKHVYHSDCILPWLELHNSCPVCRYELPTDDPDYEQRARGGRVSGGADGGGQGSGVGVGVGVGSGIGGGSGIGVGVIGGGGGSDGSQENSQNDRTVERRFRISLPWPFRASGSPAEGSNSSGDGNAGGESNSRGRENRDFGSETRQEELD